MLQYLGKKTTLDGDIRVYRKNGECYLEIKLQFRAKLSISSNIGRTHS